jgi:hypothetical protein
MKKTVTATKKPAASKKQQARKSVNNSNKRRAVLKSSSSTTKSSSARYTAAGLRQKFSSVKDMFKTIKRKQQQQQLVTNKTTESSIDPASNKNRSQNDEEKKKTTPQSPPPVVVKRNLFGIRLDHTQLNRDLKEMWQEQIERQKVQWNFDFEKLKPVTTAVVPDNPATSGSPSKATRSRTRSTSLGEKLAAELQPAALATCEDPSDECVLLHDKRYEWKKVNTQLLAANTNTHVTTRHQQQIQQQQQQHISTTPVHGKTLAKTSVDMTPVSCGPASSCSLRTTVNNPYSHSFPTSSYGMAVSAFTDSEIDIIHPTTTTHSPPNYEQNDPVYIYDDDSDDLQGDFFFLYLFLFLKRL